MKIQIEEENIADYILRNFFLESILSEKYVFFDLEATGLDFSAERITQIGLISVGCNGKREEFDFIIDPEKTIPKFIANLTGIFDSTVIGKPKFADVWPRIYDKFKDFLWIAQCGFEFDFRIIDAECCSRSPSFPRRSCGVFPFLVG